MNDRTQTTDPRLDGETWKEAALRLNAETTVTKNHRNMASLLANEIESSSLKEVAEEDDQYRTDQKLIVLALRYLSESDQ